MTETKENVRHLINLIGTAGYRPGSSCSPGYTYHTIPVPGFLDVSVHKSTAHEEWEWVKKRHPLWSGLRTLDIGSNIGFFTYAMARGGARVDAVEADGFVKDALDALLAYAPPESGMVRTWESVETALDDADTSWDVILMLNVHMWLVKKHGKDRCMEIMKDLSGRASKMYFQTAGSESAGMHIVKFLDSRSKIERYLHEAGWERVTHLHTTTSHGGKRHLFEASH